jgi:hypothetical protein
MATTPVFPHNAEEISKDVIAQKVHRDAIEHYIQHDYAVKLDLEQLIQQLNADNRNLVKNIIKVIIQNQDHVPANIEAKIKNQISNRNVYSKTIDNHNNVDYTFDGVYFENVEKIGDFPLIINLKNAIKQENKKEQEQCEMILKNQHPQLNEFMLKHEENFKNFDLTNNQANQEDNKLTKD